MGKPTKLNPIEALDPKARSALEYYVNPVYKSYGNMSAAARAAGYESGSIFHTNQMAEALAFVREQQEEQSKEVSAYLGRNAMQAARRMVQQAASADEVRPKPVSDAMLDPASDEFNPKLVETITKHNRAAAAVMREAQSAMRLILAYHLGTPEHRITAKGEDGGDPLDLGALSDEQLRELARHVDEVRAIKKGPPSPAEEGDPYVDVDYELVD